MDFEGAFFDTCDFTQTDTVIGGGTFGIVYLVLRKSDNKKFAGKVIKPEGLLNGRDQLKFLRESQLLHKLNHPAIVQFFGINFHSFKDPRALEPTILTEYISNGSLQDILSCKHSNKAWNSTKKYICLLGISHAMSYLHYNRVLHRDLKPANVLIDDNFYPKVCDFGVSRCFSEEFIANLNPNMTIVGSPAYMAPELLDPDEDSYGAAVDVYAFGLLAFEVITGLSSWGHLKPFPKLAKFSKMVLSGERPKFNSNASEKMIALIQKCWAANPYDRPSFDEIFRLLSTDFSHSKNQGELNMAEINGYIEKLNEKYNVNVSSNQIENMRISSLLFDSSKLTIGEEIGRGSQGVFFNASLNNKNGKSTKYTLKIIEKIPTINSQTTFLESIELQASLKHPAVLPLIGFSIPTDKFPKFSVITEAMPNGSLHKLLQKVANGQKPQNYETLKAIIIFGIAAGMAYMHQHDVVLADLRPSIILFDDQNRPKIGGFVNAFFLKQGCTCHSQQAERGIGTYMAPEILQGSTPFSNKIDVFAYGITLFMLLTETPSIEHGKKSSQIVEDAAKKTSKPFADLIKSCLDKNPDNRPSFMQLVQKFLKERDTYFDMSKIDEKKFDEYIDSVLKDLAFW